MSADKQRWLWEHAQVVAQEICRALAPVCTRLEVAGSLRRRKREVGDIEILYVPKITKEPNPDNLFGELVDVNAADLEIRWLETTGGMLERRKNVKGSEMFGEKNKLMRHVRSGIPVDLFAATEENWFNYLVCRTGGAENNVAIASAAQRKGWKWNPYGPGFSCEAHQGTYGEVPAQVRVVTSEEDVFRFVGLAYRPPCERT